MSRIARVLIALAVAVTFETGALAADWCAASCEVTRASGTTAGAPACHHPESPLVSLARMTSAPKRCGHDHLSVVAMAAVPSSVSSATPAPLPVSRHPISPVSPFNDVSAVGAIAIAGWAAPDTGPSTRTIPLALSSILRI